MGDPIPIRSRRDALNWLRALDLYELAELPPDQCLEVAYQLVQALRRFNLPVRRDYSLWLADFLAAHDIARHKWPDLPALAIHRYEDEEEEHP